MYERRGGNEKRSIRHPQRHHLLLVIRGRVRKTLRGNQMRSTFKETCILARAVIGLQSNLWKLPCFFAPSNSATGPKYNDVENDDAAADSHNDSQT